MATLITGLGYIGSALAQRLLAEGEQVIAIENFFSTPRECVVPLLASPGMTLIEGSISDSATVERAFASATIESVFHLAAQASARIDAAPLAVTQETNFTGPRVLLDACHAHRAHRIVIASSMRLYQTPLPEIVSEASPVDPSDLVHLSQLYGEVLLAEHRRRSGQDGLPSGKELTGVAARLGIVFGLSPVMKQDRPFLAAPQLFCLQAALGEPLDVTTGPGSVLAFVHVDDAVEAFIRCRSLSDDVEVVNVASEARSIASVAEAVRDAAAARGIAVRIRMQGHAPRARNHRVDSRLTDFRPSLRIEDGIGAVLDHYLTIQNSPPVAAQGIR